jgi:hypothetical protein
MNGDSRPAWDATVLGWCSNSPGNPYLAEAWFTRRRWERGDCPCCGGPLASPAAIGEAVAVCGACARPGHVTGGWGRLLAAIVAAPDHCPA